MANGTCAGFTRSVMLVVPTSVRPFALAMATLIVCVVTCCPKWLACSVGHGRAPRGSPRQLLSGCLVSALRSVDALARHRGVAGLWNSVAHQGHLLDSTCTECTRVYGVFQACARRCALPTASGHGHWRAGAELPHGRACQVLPVARVSAAALHLLAACVATAELRLSMARVPAAALCLADGVSATLGSLC